MSNYNSNILTNLAKARERFEQMEEEKQTVYNFLVDIADALGYKVKKIQDAYNRGPYGILFNDPDMPIELLALNVSDTYCGISNREMRREYDYRFSRHQYPRSIPGVEGLTEKYKQTCINEIKKFVKEVKQNPEYTA